MKNIPQILLLIASSCIANAQAPKYTANFYSLDSDQYLGKIVQLYVEDVTLIGDHPDAPVIEFATVTFDGMEPHGVANILVDKKDAQQFYKKYSTDGFKMSESVGTTTRSGWVAKRLKATLIKHDGKLYYYMGRISPFKDLDGYLSLTSHAGSTIQAKVIGVRNNKVGLELQNGNRITVDFSDLDGNSQRLVREASRR